METPRERLQRAKRIVRQMHVDPSTVKPIDTTTLSPNEKLDLVLEYIESITMPPFRTFTDAQSELAERGIKFGKYSDELFRMLMKLETDKIIHTELDSNNIKRYYATFDGNLFVSKGGYVEKEKRESTSAYLKSIELCVIAIGTGVAGLYALCQFAQWIYERW